MGVPLHDADIIILLDDWYNDLATKGSQLWITAKNFVTSNKDYIYPMIGGIIRSYFG